MKDVRVIEYACANCKHKSWVAVPLDFWFQDHCPECGHHNMGYLDQEGKRIGHTYGLLNKEEGK